MFFLSLVIAKWWPSYMPEIICPDGQEKLKQFRAVEFFPELLNCLIFLFIFSSHILCEFI